MKFFLRYLMIISKKKKLFNLLITIHNYQRANSEKVPITEKYYHCAKKTVFRKKILQMRW